MNYELRGELEDWFLFYSDYDKEEVRRTIDSNCRNNIYKRKHKDILFTPTTEKNKQLATSPLHGSAYAKALPEVCCFSGKHDSVLMWSHYANNHKGVCLSFRSTPKDDRDSIFLESEYFPFIPVKYSKKAPPKINLLNPKDRGEKLAEFLITKYFDWSYENEYRLLNITHQSKDIINKQYKKESLEGIIFGLNTELKDMQAVYKVIKTNYLDMGININFYKMRDNSKNYDITKKRIYKINKFLKL